MKKYTLFFYLLLFVISSQKIVAQTYFPSAVGTWETQTLASQNWCQDKVDSLYKFLERKNTKSFIILKDGKIILEKYFGTFTQDSVWYWASAGKSLTGALVGIAQQENLLNINNKASDYLGVGWTTTTLAQENAITVKNLLSMTSGLNPLAAGGDNSCDIPSCFTYLTPAGDRWFYHTAAYKRLQVIVTNASGVPYQQYTNTKIKTPIGMSSGAWSDGLFFSRTRDMARFGLLMMNRGTWNGINILNTAYFDAMTNSSQMLNPSYGYLWWLNGKGSFLPPGSPLLINTNLIPAAPADLVAALGKNDQKIHVVPSQKLVVIRMGNAAGASSDAITSFDNDLWIKINDLVCNPATALDNQTNDNTNINIYPNPTNDFIEIEENKDKIKRINKVRLYDIYGKEIALSADQQTTQNISKIEMKGLSQGIYILQMFDKNAKMMGTRKVFKKDF